MKQSYTNIARKYKPMQTHANACSGMHHYAPYDIYNQYQYQNQNQNQIIVDDVVVHAREGNAGFTKCTGQPYEKTSQKHKNFYAIQVFSQRFLLPLHIVSNLIANTPMMTTTIRLLKVDFKEIITPAELPLFRGVMIALSGGNPLFHNHAPQGFRYAYPLIQYKLAGGSPSILGIDEGADILASMISEGNEIACCLGRRNVAFHVASIADWMDDVGFSDHPETYLIQNWLPLNGNNFNDYCNSPSIIERLSLLQRILTGNILSFSKGMGIFLDGKVTCNIEDMVSEGSVIFKGVELVSFSGRFSSNVVLPRWIGLGKAASLNHGTVIRL